MPHVKKRANINWCKAINEYVGIMVSKADNLVWAMRTMRCQRVIPSLDKTAQSPYQHDFMLWISQSLEFKWQRIGHSFGST